MKKKPEGEIFISYDIEADGPIPIKYSMLAMAGVVFSAKLGVVLEDSFEVHLFPLAGAIKDPDTMEWWAKQPETWKYITSNQKEPIPAMESLNRWGESIADKYHCKPVFAGYPVTFDHMFIYMYALYLTGKCPFGFNGFDAKSYAAALLCSSFSDTVKSKMPKNWFYKVREHTHRPLDDAIGQAQLMVNMLRLNLGMSL